MAFRRGRRLFLLCQVWFLVTIAPAFLAVQGTVSLTVMAERYLYVPSIAVALLAAQIFVSLMERKGWRPAGIVVGLAVLAGLGAFGVREQTKVWQTDLGFWQQLVRNDSAATHSTPWLNLGVARRWNGEPEEAFVALERATAGEIDRVYAWTQMASIRFEQALEQLRAKDHETAAQLAGEAQSHLLQAKQHSDDKTFPYFDLAAARIVQAEALHAQTGRQDVDLLESSCDDLRAVLERQPDRTDALGLLLKVHERLASAYARLGLRSEEQRIRASAMQLQDRLRALRSTRVEGGGGE